MRRPVTLACGLILVACATAVAEQHGASVSHEPAIREASSTVTYDAHGKTEPGAKEETVKGHAAKPAVPADQSAGKSPTHGIIRKAPAREPQSQPQAASQPRPASQAPTKVASTEAVAAAIANAVRSVEKPEKPATAGVSRPANPAASRVARVPPRRYVVRWPSSRVQLRWGEPETRVRLSWNGAEGPEEHQPLP